MENNLTLTREGYIADMYLRISREDGDKAESDSIANQRDLIYAFLEKHPEITLQNIRIDDGYTGVSFDRPAFSSMMESVKNSEINCIIVKDLSRLGRNFIEAGKYVERIFPFMGVRFIAINDDYDSLKPQTASDNLILPVKNLMNDAYCRDISIKIRSQLDVKRRKGECIAPFAVYGYLKDPDQKNHLIADDYAADVIRDIFKRKLDGLSAQMIADSLNEQDVLSPMEYKKLLGSNYKSPFKRSAKAVWTAGTIQRILKNPVYIGTLTQGKRRTPNYKVKKVFTLPEEQWVVVENTHEAIVSPETFDNVAKILRTDTRTAPGEEAVFPLAGLIVCGDCGKNMVRKNNASSQKPYIYYVCAGSKQKSGCTSHIIRDYLLEQAVFTSVQTHIRSVLDLEQTLSAIENLPFTTREVKKTDKRLLAKRAEMEKYHQYKMKLHESYTDSVISREDYIAFGKRYDKKMRQAEDAILSLEQDIEKLSAGTSDQQQWITYFKQYRDIDALTRKLAVELIDRIFVYENQKLHIKFKFQCEYENAIAFVTCANSLPPCTSPNKEVL